jgi:hypothetical protein
MLLFDIAKMPAGGSCRANLLEPLPEMRLSESAIRQHEQAPEQRSEARSFRCDTGGRYVPRMRIIKESNPSSATCIH